MQRKFYNLQNCPKLILEISNLKDAPYRELLSAVWIYQNIGVWKDAKKHDTILCPQTWLAS